MKILGLLPNKREEKEITKVIDSITFIYNYSEISNYLREEKPDVILFWNFEINEELMVEIIQRIKTVSQKSLIYVLGEKGTINLVAGAIWAGAKDYILKPYDLNKILYTIERDFEKIQRNSSETKKIYDIMLGSTKEMIEIYKSIGHFSKTMNPILVSGESGTGKELFSKIVHNFNKKENGEFFVINGEISDFVDKLIFGEEVYHNNILIELKKSYLEKAHKGTILIKKVENLKLETQIKLLDFLETGIFNRINGKENLTRDVRIIFSSNKNLDELLEGNFIYEGLLEKVKNNMLYLPPLRERKDDIPELVSFFIDYFNEELKLNIKGIDKLALGKIMKYHFPNNIKELKSVIKSSLALSRENYILVEDLPAQVIGTKISKRYGQVHDWILADWVEGEIEILEKTDKNNYYDNLISRVERELIRQVLEKTNGKKVESAELLGITRTTLRTKMNTFGLE